MASSIAIRGLTTNPGLTQQEGRSEEGGLGARGGGTMAPNLLLTGENSADFFEGRDKPVKAVLFTKKMETPNLWLRVAEAFDARCDFGEVRLAEEALMKRFDLTAEVLPKIVAVRTSGDGTQQTIVYEGPNDFEKIGEFLRDSAEGGRELVDLKRQVEELTRQARGLRVEVAQEQETTKAARAEAARLKLSQVGQVEAVRKSLETELQQAHEREASVKERLESEVSGLKDQLQAAQKDHDVLSKEVEMLKGMQGESASSATLVEPETLDTFLDNKSRTLKALLMTKKEEIPELWQQLAEVHTSVCAFGMVRHVHDSILQTFSVRVESLPRILLISSRTSPPLVYEGPLKLENISAFINDALEGGSACIELRKQLQASQANAEALQREVAEAKRAAQVQRDQMELVRREQVGTLESTVKSLQSQLKAACAGAGAEMQRTRADADARVRAAESMAAELSAELVRERQATQDKILEAVSRKEALLKADRQKLEHSTWADEVLERELKLAEKAARTCERAVLKAASAVHVTLVRSARENERTHAALREFIDDIVPSQVCISAVRACMGVREKGRGGVLRVCLCCTHFSARA